MITRRTILGASVAVASTACMTGFKAYAATPSFHLQPIDALLVDNSVQLPRQIAAFVKAQRLPVVGIELDAAGYSGLMEIMGKSHAIAGISSGATLFCLERLAWNHGYRLTGRTQHCLSALNYQACQQDMTAFLLAAHSPHARLSPETTSYRPSHTDDTLHAWVMRKHHRQTSRVV